MNTRPTRRWSWSFLLFCCATSTASAQFDIQVNYGSGMPAGSPQQLAFERAVQQWESYFGDNITVVIDADYANLGGSGTIGQTQNVRQSAAYDTVRTAMIADKAGDGSENILDFLPTSTQVQFLLSKQSTVSNPLQISGSQANFKALGLYSGSPTASDGKITFNNQFSFDLDRSDGIAANQLDFETVALHEIGHLLGFISSVDQFDAGGIFAKGISPTTMDLFRFQASGSNNPSTNAEFTTLPRELRPGQEAVFDDIDNEWALSTGASKGDGRQASHWKDDSLTGTLIGVMDPTLGFGQVFTITDADIRVFGLIGYNVVPEPGSFVLLFTAGAGWFIRIWYRRGKAPKRQPAALPRAGDPLRETAAPVQAET
jgi:hypothetical protein